MSSLKNSLLVSSMASAPPLASFPGWAGPVVRAKRQAGQGDSLLNPALPLEGTRKIFEARVAADVVKLGALIVEARELGLGLGRSLCERTIASIEADILAVRFGEGDPDLAGNVPAILKRFSTAAHEIFVVHQLSDGPMNEATVAHWMAARGEVAVGALKYVITILERHGETLALAVVPEEWVDDLSNVVKAFVFPGDGDAPKDDAWRQAIIERFDAIRALLPEHQPASF
ncbi:hypothetical protein [Aureimonas sp. AU22]|uniref:hypothetical protein n=1 Tax=Aureimonas sp. AU22 TaxID=1638162 RepID=UPI00070620F5|nr:hypothetical protein [Aureimonas sp. AU22]BAT30096.1 hypothetical protein [Aureimonas sp. AU22]